MRRLRPAVAILLALGLALPAPLPARYARRADMVGPQWSLVAECPAKVQRLNGGTIGRAIPIAGLQLGTRVIPATTSFTTGGSGTANASLAIQRKAAGLPYEPETFDPSSSARPSVFVGSPEGYGPSLPYQRLPLKQARGDESGLALIYAQATTRRIAALTLTLSSRPTARPRYRIVNRDSESRQCSPERIDVYAPDMSVRDVGRLFTDNNCNWNSIIRCEDRSQWPSGRVLFVRQEPHGSGYEHRWVDYDMLADQFFGSEH